MLNIVQMCVKPLVRNINPYAHKAPSAFRHWYNTWMRWLCVRTEYQYTYGNRVMQYINMVLHKTTRLNMVLKYPQYELARTRHCASVNSGQTKTSQCVYANHQGSACPTVYALFNEHKHCLFCVSESCAQEQATFTEQLSLICNTDKRMKYMMTKILLLASISAAHSSLNDA